MNDNEVITTVRAQRDSVPMTARGQIIRRGRAVRTRRLIPGWPQPWGRQLRRQSP